VVPSSQEYGKDFTTATSATSALPAASAASSSYDTYIPITDSDMSGVYTSVELKTYTNFDEMDLNEDLLRGIYSYGFEEPSRIQRVAIVPMRTGRDFIAQAQSGTGKTGTFAIGMLNNLDKTLNKLQAIILLPTRELAEQVYDVVSAISSYMKIKTLFAIGGENTEEQRKTLHNGAQVMIGTPGRVYDLIVNKSSPECVEQLKMLILDEADEMLSEDFQVQVREIFRFIPPTIQVCLFSATLSEDILNITKRFLRDPIKILVEPEKLTLDGIRQYYVQMREQDKFAVLMDLYESMSISQTIIFCNSRERVEDIAERLRKNNFTVGMIHGSKEWKHRKSILRDFREGKLRILLATDILSRGIDVQQVAIVINFDIPRDIAKYLHRIGRAGRYGRKGIGINFLTRETEEQLNAIMKHYKVSIEEMPTNFTKHI
jgi:translation initiation factor 4A